MLKVAKEMLAKGKTSKFKVQSSGVQLHKVKPFLVFVVAKYDFLAGRKHTCSESSRRLPAQIEL